MFTNVTGYQFISLNNLPKLKLELTQFFQERSVKGTILIGEEGINVMLSGENNSLNEGIAFLKEKLNIDEFPVRESHSDLPPYQKMVVKIKKEIITMKCPEVNPEKSRAPSIAPKQLKTWFDDEKDFVILDTRNRYEHQIGTFDKALTLDIGNFSEFPKVVESLDDSIKNKPVVVFCTGGIRCEKAAPWMLEHGFKEVYQLQGGILDYFKDNESAHYWGDCFVFDDRVAVNPKLEETGANICNLCRQVYYDAAQHVCR